MELNPDQLKTIIIEAIYECKIHESKLTITIDEAVKLSGIGRNKLSELIYKNDSDIPYFKIGSKFLINRQLFIEWLNKITENKQIL